MNAKEAAARQELSRAVITEAAAWVARLHGPLRTPAVERGFRNWLAAAPEHARAFELVTDSWDEVPVSKSGAAVTMPQRGNVVLSGTKKGWIPLAAAAAAATIAASGLLYYSGDSDVTTGIGEQRLLTLDDGTRVYLNTSSRVVVSYDKKQRHIRLDAGEAFFEVATVPNWPFVVAAGGREIKALGTSFLVRRDEQQTTVTLVEGKVAVQAQAEQTVLAPGERITYYGTRSVSKADKPVVEKLTAWRRGKVPIENLSLADAIAEMNRYSRVRLRVAQPAAGRLRVSGIFQVGDSLSFARAVADSYGLAVEQREREIVLVGNPRNIP